MIEILVATRAQSLLSICCIHFLIFKYQQNFLVFLPWSKNILC
jgi:hypothetical protein